MVNKDIQEARDANDKPGLYKERGGMEEKTKEIIDVATIVFTRQA